MIYNRILTRIHLSFNIILPHSSNNWYPRVIVFEEGNGPQVFRAIIADGLDQKIDQELVLYSIYVRIKGLDDENVVAFDVLLVGYKELLYFV